jgi:uncharacterized protein (TIGR03083 family)
MNTAGQHYRVIRTQLSDLAATLSDERAETPVPALPGWSVRDTYAHLAGISTDIVNGTAGNPKNDAWTAGHLAARRDRSLSEICEEWTVNGPGAEAILDDPTARSAVFAVFDVFHHGHDIRGALGLTDSRDTPEAAFVVTVTSKLRRGGWATAGHPPIQLTADSGSWLFGPDGAEPTAALATSDFELSRILIGRRSRAQMLAAGWSGGR